MSIRASKSEQQQHHSSVLSEAAVFAHREHIVYLSGQK